MIRSFREIRMSGCMKITHPRLLIPLVLALGLSSCATYTTPGRPADLTLFTEPKARKAYTARPAIRFPANIAIVRVQEGGYVSAQGRAHGQGAYSVVTKRDIEKEKDVDALSQLPGLAGAVKLNRLLLPQTLNTDEDLREAAAKLHADAILIYTLNTEFRSNDVLPPLTALSLGILNTTRYQITATASAILMDTKTGYIYGALEESSDETAGAILFDGSDFARQKAERSAFEKLLTSFGPFWKGLYARHR